jgi:hypothetical protein
MPLENKEPIEPIAVTSSTVNSGRNPFAIDESSSELQVTVKKAVADEVLQQVKDYTNKILIYLLVALGGAIAASVWNLNAQIHQAVGAAGVSSKALELEITRLKDEAKKNSQQLTLKDCLENKKVIDKAGCYRGN